MARKTTFIVLALLTGLALYAFGETAIYRGADGNVYKRIRTYELISTDTGQTTYSEVWEKVDSPEKLRAKAAELRTLADGLDAQADSLAALLGEPAPKEAVKYKYELTVKPDVPEVVLEEVR